MFNGVFDGLLEAIMMTFWVVVTILVKIIFALLAALVRIVFPLMQKGLKWILKSIKAWGRPILGDEIGDEVPFGEEEESGR